MFGMQAALEFGVVDSERRNPIAAGLASGALFLGGAIPPIIPFVFMSDTGEGLIASAALSSIGLFAVGAVKTLATRKNAVLSGLENLALGLLGAALAYLVGRAFDSFIT
jgi:VIT1/CCC1 family predicted Fe2+/Mn2+ transporter